MSFEDCFIGTGANQVGRAHLENKKLFVTYWLECLRGLDMHVAGK